jgi:hypothetical protein
MAQTRPNRAPRAPATPVQPMMTIESIVKGELVKNTREMSVLTLDSYFANAKDSMALNNGLTDLLLAGKPLQFDSVKGFLNTLNETRDKVKYPNRFLRSDVSATCQAIDLSLAIRKAKSGELLSNLAADDYPILFEGLHTCLYLSHPSIKHKLKAVRMHNVEWDYYKKLGNAERNYLFKFYYNVESLRLKKFEEQLQHGLYSPAALQADAADPRAPAQSDQWSGHPCLRR